MLKSIKDKNDINFQKVPDNLNFEINEIQKLKPNLELANFDDFIRMMLTLFGNGLKSIMGQYSFEFKDQYTIFRSKDIKSKIQECKKHDEQFKVFENEVLPKFNLLPKTVMVPGYNKDLNIEDLDRLKKQLKKNQEVIKVT